MDHSRTPVIAAVGQVTEREEIVDAVELASRAAFTAVDSAPGLRDRIQRLTMVSVIFSSAPGDAASRIATRLGRTAHWIADAGFPPGASREDGALRYAHFASFCESRREKFPLVFYGHEDPALARADWDGFALETLRVASDNDRELARAYAAAGEPPDPSFFDDRSVPFAVGSLSYSRSVTNIVRVWLAAWQQAEGDMGRTPYWNPAGAGKVQGGD